MQHAAWQFLPEFSLYPGSLAHVGAESVPEMDTGPKGREWRVANGEQVDRPSQFAVRRSPLAYPKPFVNAGSLPSGKDQRSGVRAP